MRLMTVSLALGWLAACAQPTPTPPNIADALAAGNYSVVDLTHPYYQGLPEFRPPPHLGQSPAFKLEEISRYDERGADIWYWNWFQMSEHTGTHVDAPNHWFSGKDFEAIDEIPVDRLVSPAAVIDVKAKAGENPDYMVSVEDLEAWEQTNGQIPQGAVVIMNSGWSEKYADPAVFLGLNDAGEVHFPGFSPDTVRWLLENRDINAIASDTLSTDALGVAADPPLPVHIEMHGAGKYQIELMANLDELPAAGAWVVVAPMKIRGGSGAPSRIFGLVPASS